MAEKKKTSKKPKKVVKRKTSGSRRLTKGKIYINATFNNTLISVADIKGGVIFWGSTGRSGFKGSRKYTPFAATTAIEKVVDQAKAAGLREAQVYIKGPGPGRDAALRVLRASGIKITLLADVTPIPHNGCRPKKKKHG
jgi:small subunit ribosomal protein S11